MKFRRAEILVDLMFPFPIVHRFQYLVVSFRNWDYRMFETRIMGDSFELVFNLDVFVFIEVLS